MMIQKEISIFLPITFWHQSKSILAFITIIFYLLISYKIASCQSFFRTPGLEGIQITNLVIDPTVPSTIYAGTIGCGVYKSTDGGDNWFPINTGLPDSPDTFCVSMDPSNCDTLYVGTVGFGIFKSTNSGDSWYQISNNVTNLRVHMAPAIDPTNTSILYVGTEGPFFKSDNGGFSWFDSSTGLGDRTEVCAIAIDPVNSSMIYAGLHYDPDWNDGGVFKSLNGGETWERKSEGLPDPRSYESGVNFLTIDPTDNQTVYASMNDGVYRTRDGGDHWENISGGPEEGGLPSAPAYGLAIDPSNPDTIYVGIWEHGVFMSTQGGTIWQPINTGLTNLFILGVSIDPANPSILYAGTGNGVFKIISGDFDEDGDVDGSDLAEFSESYTNGSIGADLTGDGPINSEDVEAFAQNFGIVPFTCLVTINGNVYYNGGENGMIHVAIGNENDPSWAAETIITGPGSYSLNFTHTPIFPLKKYGFLRRVSMDI